jgi:hypothetical protein
VNKVNGRNRSAVRIRIKGRYRDQKLELDRPLDIDEGTEVSIEIHLTESEDQLREAIAALGMRRLEEEWDNPEDAIYDDWRTHYGV